MAQLVETAAPLGIRIVVTFASAGAANDAMEAYRERWPHLAYGTTLSMSIAHDGTFVVRGWRAASAD